MPNSDALFEHIKRSLYNQMKNQFGEVTRLKIEEVKKSLNNQINNQLSKEEVRLKIVQILKTAFGGFKFGSDKYNELHLKLQLLLAQDNLNNSNEPFAEVLKLHPAWLAMPQATLNILTEKKLRHKTYRERFLDFCINAWSQFNLGPAFVRRSFFILNFAYLYSCSFSVGAIISALPLGGPLAIGFIASAIFTADYFTNFFFRLTAKSSLKTDFEQFKIDNPQYIAKVREDFIKNLRQETYILTCWTLEIKYASDTSEELNKKKEDEWDFYMNSQEEDFLATLKEGFAAEKLTFDIELMVNGHILNTGFNRLRLAAKAFYNVITSPFSADENRIKGIFSRGLMALGASVALPTLLVLDLTRKAGVLMFLQIFPFIAKHLTIATVFLISTPALAWQAMVNLKKWFEKAFSTKPVPQDEAPCNTPTPVPQNNPQAKTQSKNTPPQHLPSPIAAQKKPQVEEESQPTLQNTLD